MGIKSGALALICLVIAGCAPGHCRRKVDPPVEAKPVDAAPVATKADKLTAKDRVLVYKYDGSTQCGEKAATSPDEMAKELRGIPILSSEKRGDGLMHISSCGGSTGRANVYEISARYLNKAEAKGFRRWTFE